MIITGVQVAAKRKALKMSRDEFAQKCGLTASKLWRIETKGQFKTGEEAAILKAFFPDIEIIDAVAQSDGWFTSINVPPLPPLPEFPSLPPIKKGGFTFPNIDISLDMEVIDKAAAIDLNDISLDMEVIEKAAIDLKEIGNKINKITKIQTPTKPEITFNYDTTRYVSHSEIATFQDCRRRWWLSWHRGYRPAVESPVGALAMGTRVHKAMERYYAPKGVKSEDPRDVLEGLIVKDWTTLTNQYFEQGNSVPPEVKKKFDTEAKMQRVMIAGYLEWEAAEGSGQLYETIEPESFVVASHGVWHDDRELKMVGRIDRLVRRVSDGTVLFEDFKTAASISQLMKVLPINTQMKHYLMLLTLREVEKDDYTMMSVAGALYTVLRKSMQSQTATPPFYARVEVYHNLHERDAYTAKISGELERIEEAEKNLALGAHHHTVVPPRPTNDCAWKCPFFSICPMFDDGSGVESMLEAHFVVGKPLDYYDPTKKETE